MLTVRLHRLTIHAPDETARPSPEHLDATETVCPGANPRLVYYLASDCTPSRRIVPLSSPKEIGPAQLNAVVPIRTVFIRKIIFIVPGLSALPRNLSPRRLDR